MGYMGQYIAEEMAAEYRSGRISYRELLRRFTLLTGSAVAAMTLAVSLGCSSSSTPPPSAAPTSTIAATVAATATAAPLPSATATTAPTAAPGPTTAPSITATALPRGVTIPPDDPSIQAGDVTFKNGDITLMGYLARPRDASPHPAVLVIHENRGLVPPHYQDIARRLAKEGYVALSLDLLSREGGTATFTDTGRASATLGQASQTRLADDMNGGVRYLQGLSFVRSDRVGAMGFCFGGGMVWLLCTKNPDIKAAVPFYGPAPTLSDVPNIRAAVLGLYGANDNFINPGVPALDSALTQNNKAHKFVTYPGAGHAFFNDTGGAYNATAAEGAWRETLAWFNQYLKG